MSLKSCHFTRGRNASSHKWKMWVRLHPHVTFTCGSKFLYTLSRVEITVYAVYPYIFVYADDTVSEPVLFRARVPKWRRAETLCVATRTTFKPNSMSRTKCCNVKSKLEKTSKHYAASSNIWFRNKTPKIQIRIGYVSLDADIFVSAWKKHLQIQKSSERVDGALVLASFPLPLQASRYSIRLGIAHKCCLSVGKKCETILKFH